MTDEQQIRKAECLVESILPRVFFLEVDPFVVIDRENRLLAGGALAPPHADGALLRLFVALKPPSLKPFTAFGFFQELRDQGLLQRVDALGNTFIHEITPLRNQRDTDSAFRSALEHLPKGTRIQRGTRFILRELVRPLIRESRNVTRNDAMDFYHAVVPSAYCDIVLLDKHWKTQVDRVRSRLSKANMDVPIATVFSKKDNGVDRFVRKLEGR